MKVIHEARLKLDALLHGSARQDQLALERTALADERALVQAERERLAAEADSRRQQGAAASSGSPFMHYQAVFDAQSLVRRHAVSGLIGTPEYLTNFLGVMAPPDFLPEVIRQQLGQVEGVPIPANWHADVAEWAGALRAVELAEGRFTMIELGCGWGCWMNNTGVAARRLNLDVHVIGVEGDKTHVASARRTCALNGLEPQQVTLHHGIAAARSGLALFPKQEGVHWGGQPIFDPSDEQRQQALESGSYEELPIFALSELCDGYDKIDLLHVDIQGGEADLIDDSLSLLNRTVAYLVIGTHSRQLEGRLFQTLLAAGWQLEVERAAILGLTAAGPHIVVDGVQGWRNPNLT
jgi:FkbM family methyltransferase